MSIDPTVSIHRFDREARRALAGVFETTPKGLFVYLGGKPQDYDDGTEVMMEWHLRALGYERREYRPLCWTPVRVSWVRKQRWPEDGPLDQGRQCRDPRSARKRLRLRGEAAMAGLDDFAKRLDRIAVRVEGNVERAVKDCAGAVARSVISNTPVDTGRARSNWTAQMNAAFAGLFPATVPGVAGSTAEANAAAAIEAAEQVIETFDIGKNGSIHIANNLPYIGALNDGHSRQAPADFVRIAVLEGLATVQGAKIIDE